MTPPHEQLVEAISNACRENVHLRFGENALKIMESGGRLGLSGGEADEIARCALQALSDLGAMVLMSTKVAEIPEASTVHLCPPTVSLNWPEGAYQPFVNGDSKVYVNALEGRR